MSHLDNHDEDDLFADTRMSFGDHIEELRQHMLRALYGFLIALVFSVFVGKWAMQIIAGPVERQLIEFYDNRASAVKDNLASDPELMELNQPRVVQVGLPRRQLLEALGLNPGPDNPAPQWVEMPMLLKPVDVALELVKANQRIGRRPGLSTLSVQEAFLVYFKVCIFCAIIVSSPWVFYQLWSFVAAGLYPHEKRPVHVYLPFSVGLFLLGAILCQIFVIPQAIKYLLTFNEWLGLEPDVRLNEWLGFAILLPLVFGFAFQTPLVMMALYRIGLVPLDTYRNNRRLAWFLLAITAALITPPDAVTLMFLWVPLVGLYELGILLCLLTPKPPELDLDVPDPEDLVEV